jgi:hypothetical protein
MPASEWVGLLLGAIIIIGSVVFAIRSGFRWNQIQGLPPYWRRSAMVALAMVVLAALGIFGSELVPTPWKSLLLTCGQIATLILAVAFVIFPWTPPIRGRMRWQIAWLTFALLACGAWIVLSRKDKLAHVPPWLIFLIVIAFAASYQFWQYRRSPK